ncbi:aminotransferase class V-fold PLP-dependent enzyme [Mesorhizobium sp. B2-4-14]|uniref:pyridoxal phosphate-dependent decarboxylase family protein n=1 Tax=Mesorhizobium sp. B2-4-14 TaxID=2589935 RepID=UPI001127A4A7|nr:pyridoxal-dependent decarboxylase [Mesorhizobium sp. B2-4-14]TPL06104.1 aminotransferase class V-fold PLP-dependent enzyme [Mesorhizobium sp. B2-4-14]
MSRAIEQERVAAAEAADTSGSLDPSDWDQFRELAHDLLDDMITHVETIRQRPVWQRPSDEARARFVRPLPKRSRELGDVLDDVRAHIVPFATGNLHPAFMGWVHGAGTPIGMVAEIVAGGLNMNCGGRDHAGLVVEQQIVRWMSEALGYPAGANGLFLTGSSMANFVAVTIAKTEALGQSVRETGLRDCDRQLVAYTSAEAHSCIAQAMQLSGIGSANLRTVAVDHAGRMLPGALCDTIGDDRAAGFLPFLVVGTAGTVNTGAIDPLAEIAEIASREKLWFHVDGAIGALAVLSDSLRELFKGIENSASVALDFHKCGQVPYDAGFLLVRDGDAQKRTFAQPAAYLQRGDRGLAAGETWPCDLGPDLSRGFRALKTWMTIEALGTDRIGGSIAHTCRLARHLAETLERHPAFQLKAPVALNIVCFGIRGADSEFIRDLVLDLQESGLAAPSWTSLNGELVVRCAIVNHRTTKADIDGFVDTLDRYLADRGFHPAAAPSIRHR